MSETFHCSRALPSWKSGQQRLHLASNCVSTNSSKTIRCKALSSCIHLETEKRVEAVFSVQAVSAGFVQYRDVLIQATRVSRLHGTTRASNAIPNCFWQICEANLISTFDQVLDALQVNRSNQKQNPHIQKHWGKLLIASKAFWHRLEHDPWPLKAWKSSLVPWDLREMLRGENHGMCRLPSIRWHPSSFHLDFLVHFRAWSYQVPEWEQWSLAGHLQKNLSNLSIFLLLVAIWWRTAVQQATPALPSLELPRQLILNLKQAETTRSTDVKDKQISNSSAATTHGDTNKLMVTHYHIYKQLIEYVPETYLESSGWCCSKDTWASNSHAVHGSENQRWRWCAKALISLWTS